MAESYLLWPQDAPSSRTTTNLALSNFTTIVLHHSSTITGSSPSTFRTNYVLNFTHRLRVPYYSAILEFLNFSLLWLTFMLCLSRELMHITFRLLLKTDRMLQTKTKQKLLSGKWSSSSSQVHSRSKSILQQPNMAGSVSCIRVPLS